MAQQTEIVAEAARLFNEYGYTVASLDVIERELHVHALPGDPFADGAQLARAAFDYAADAADRLLQEAIDGETTSVAQLSALIFAFRRCVEDPPVEGGSPVLHALAPPTASFAFLEERVREVVTGWRHKVRRIVRRGIKLGEIKPSARPEQVASIIVGTMEGAVVLHRIYDDAAHLDRSVAYLHQYLRHELHA